MCNLFDNVRLPERLSPTGRHDFSQSKVVFLVSLGCGRRRTVILTAAITINGQTTVVLLAPRRIIESRIVAKNSRVQLVPGNLAAKFGLHFPTTIAWNKTLRRPFLNCLRR